jgi:hypothetical protein
MMPSLRAAIVATLFWCAPSAVIAQSAANRSVSDSNPKPSGAIAPGYIPNAPGGLSEEPLPSPQVSSEESAPKPLGPDGPGGIAGFSPVFNPLVGHAFVRWDDRLTWFPNESVKSQPTSLGYVEDDFGVSFPVWQNLVDEFTGAVNVRGEFFHTHAILLDTNQPFPEELWNVRLSGMYRHLFDNGWIAGGTLSIGSASDKPFDKIDVMTVGINTFLRIPQGEHNAWLLTLSYSPTSELPFPVPGVAYIWQPSDRFRMNIGLPFQVWYRPLDDLTFDFSYMLLRTVHARATYRCCAPVRAYVGFDWSNESYFLVDRPADNDRFFYYDKRLTGGVQVLLGPHALLDCSAGYVFDRFYFEGQNYNDRNFNSIDVGNGPFAAIRLEIHY